MTLLTSDSVDLHGLSLLVSSDVFDLLEVDLSGSSFFSPDDQFTGFGADGYAYVLGVRQEQRASWATETTSAHRGPANVLPVRFFVVLTSREVVLIHPSPLAVILRALTSPELPEGEEVPGIILDWGPEDAISPSEPALGSSRSQLRRVGWADGRLFVASSRGLRVFDFREDRCWVFTGSGRYGAGLENFSGIAFRNRSSYFSEVPDTSYAGISDPRILAARRFRGQGYVAASDASRLLVFAWGESLSTYSSDLSGIRDLHITQTGILYGLRVNEAGSLEVFRSLNEWLSTPIAGTITVSSPLPIPAGEGGSLMVHGETVFVGAGSGVWQIDMGAIRPLYRFGSSRPDEGDTLPMYSVLTPTGEEIQDVGIDPRTGNLGVLHGEVLDVVSLDQNQRVTSYTSPVIPSGPRRIRGFLSSMTGG
jgi:hypothetical protein